MNEIFWILFISLSVICVLTIGLIITISINRRRARESKKLREHIDSQTKIYNEMIEKHTTQIKDYFENKSALVADFKVATDKLREEKDSIKSFYEEELRKIKEIYNSELGHRKSSEVRLGRISEALAPFLDGWPWDPNSFRFLGNPIDGIQFNEDELIFVEIKTGKSRLSASQKWIKDLITNRKVSFATFRITENGSTLIKENGNEG